MSIAIFMYTVVTKKKEIEDKYPGGLEKYLASSYVWHDQDLVGSSFMSGSDLQIHLDNLAKCGLDLDKQNESSLVAVVRQNTGILTSCNWLEFGPDELGYASCWLKGQTPGRAVLPKELDEG